MSKRTYMLLLGSNLGKRMAMLDVAEKLLETEGCSVNGRSSVYETAAWGNTEQGAFLNRVIRVESDKNPAELLQTVRGIEQALGRIRMQQWGPRTADIDILFSGDELVNTSELVIPHPALHERRFTLVPLAELAPDLVHPLLNRSVLVLLDSCPDKLPVEKYPDSPVFPLFTAGPIAWWAERTLYRNVVFDLHEHYIKQTFRNRIDICGANGTVHLSIPVTATHKKIKMKEVRISYDQPWQRTYWRSLVSAYRGSPFFEYYDYLLEPVFMKKHVFLHELNLELFDMLSSQLQLDTAYTLSESYVEKGVDYRQSFPAKGLAGQNMQPYRQVFGDKSPFPGDPGILDLLFNKGPGAGDYLRQQAMRSLFHDNAHT